MSENLKNTPLLKEHKKLNAKMLPFAGWNMPVQYKKGILAEHRHTRSKASIFDISHMGEFQIKAANCAESMDKIFARGVKNLKTASCRYNFLLNNEGGVIDDLIIYRIEKNEYLVVVNAGNINPDAENIIKRLNPNNDFKNISEETAKIDLQGPLSAEILQKCGLKKEKLPQYFRFIKTEIFNIPCILSRTGYTGEMGFEIYISSSNAPLLWNELNKFEDVEPAGLGARDTLRLEMGYPLHGHELSENITPIHAGFSSMLKLDSGRSFPGIDKLRTLRKTGTDRCLVGLKIDGRRAARKGALLLSDDNKKIGKITSGAFSPSLNHAVAMAYIDSTYTIGDKVQIDTGRKMLSAELVKLPFYKTGSVRESI